MRATGSAPGFVKFSELLIHAGHEITYSGAQFLLQQVGTFCPQATGGKLLVSFNKMVDSFFYESLVVRQGRDSSSRMRRAFMSSDRIPFLRAVSRSSLNRKRFLCCASMAAMPKAYFLFHFTMIFDRVSATDNTMISPNFFFRYCATFIGVKQLRKNK